MQLHWQTGKAWVFGTYEIEVTKAILSTVEPGQLVVDVGANIGYFTLLLARRVGAQGKVIAFEPSNRVYAVLEKNLVLNGQENVTLVNKAVAERSGQVGFSHGGVERLSSVERIVPGSTNPVAAVSLDDYFNSVQRRVDFIKVDVEGGEMSVLEGMRGILQNDHPTLLIELHGSGSSVDVHPVVSRLVSAGYKCHFLDGSAAQGHILARVGNS